MHNDCVVQLAWHGMACLLLLPPEADVLWLQALSQASGAGDSDGSRSVLLATWCKSELVAPAWWLHCNQGPIQTEVTDGEAVQARG